MTAISHVIAVFAVTGAACTAAIVPLNADRATEPLTCELHLIESGGQVHITAEAKAQVATKGTYRLEIDRRSSAGRASIHQGGEFELRAGERAILGETSLSGRKRDLTASLSVTSDGKTHSCGSAAL